MTTHLKNYELIKKLSSGAFGEIYLALDNKTNKEVAIKIDKTSKQRQTQHEYKMYMLFRKRNSNIISTIYDYGKIDFKNELRYAIVIERLGMSIEEIFKHCNRKFTLKTVLMLADLMISRVEYIHYQHHVHRDLKPDNFMFGRQPHNRKNLYIIDFGLCKQYRSTVTYSHVPFGDGRSLIGTARYCSLNVHLGIEQTRRDDLESIGYCLIYFLKGKLPWQGFVGTKEEKYKKIKKAKEEISITELCEGLHECIYEYMIYVRSLSFSATPDYVYLRELMTNALRQQKFRYDYIFDWDNWYFRH
ncbi:hypothetical protein GVAV_002922 [Gurleya vavrai]